MDISFYVIQALNGIQYGFLLFLVASGLTLVFGVMGIINLAHGSFFMMGAYLALWLARHTGSLFSALPIALLFATAVAFLAERLAFRHLYRRRHLDHVLLTYGFILIFNELQRILWGNDVHSVPAPDLLAGSIPLTATQSYPVYRIFISIVCLGVAFGLAVAIRSTRFGMAIRAGVVNREMVEALGIDTNKLFAAVFCLGAGLAAFAGMIAAPVEAVYPGIGETFLIVSFVVVVIGGIGSLRGAFVGAMAIGLADAFGKALMPQFAGIGIYAVMAALLLWRPQGLFGEKQA
ncbi:MAG: branched-chain amino acid ABC transporter permease [Rhodospirillales bacterium]|nr:branched-chain amino acid ABC transporter permease [Rhodospirillales bacterium]